MSAPHSLSLATRLAELADAKQALEIVALDMRNLVSYTDFLVICTVRNERQAGAIVDWVRVEVKSDLALLPGGVAGGDEDGWVVLDYLDCVLHIFTAQARDRYQLEDLWREAPRLELQLGVPEEPSAASA